MMYVSSVLHWAVGRPRTHSKVVILMPMPGPSWGFLSNTPFLNHPIMDPTSFFMLTVRKQA